METMAGCLQDQDDFHLITRVMINDWGTNQIRHPFNSKFHRKQIWLAEERDELEIRSVLQHFETIITKIHF